MKECALILRLKESTKIMAGDKELNQEGLGKLHNSFYTNVSNPPEE